MQAKSKRLVNASLFSVTGAAALFFVSAGTASAQMGQGYVGAGYGWTQNQDMDIGDDTDQGWKAFLGADLGRVFGFEAGYADLGKFEVPAVGDLEARGWTVDALAGVPIGPVRPFLKVGGFYADVDSPLGRSDQSWELKYGAGVGFDFNPNVGMRVEYERYQIDNNDALPTDGNDIDMASVSLVGKF